MEYRKIVKLRKTVVVLRYLMPLICACAMLMCCALPIFRLANDDTERQKQSIFELAATSMKNSKSTLAKNGLEDVDYALARNLKVGVTVFIIVLAVILFLTLWFSLTCFASLANPPESNTANRWKVRLKLFIPGMWLEFLVPWLNLIPLTLPYYVINRFSAYYIVSGTTATSAEYYEYAVYTSGLNPLWVIFGLSLVAAVIFVAVRDWTGMYKMDVYRYYLPEPKEKPQRYSKSK